MSLRDAFERSRYLPLLVLAVIAWTVFTAVRVLGQFDYWAPETVGATPAAGIVGLFVMGIGAVLAFSLLDAFEHDDPAPETWPPEDA